MKQIIVILSLILIPSLVFAQTSNWVNSYSPPGNPGSDSAYAIVYGGDGNIYIAGVTYTSSFNSDFTVISLTTNGTQRWVYRYETPSILEGAYSIAWGPDGNVYAAGSICRNDSVYWDMTVVSLTSDGALRWTYNYNGTYSDEDHAYSMICGPDSNIYVCGYCTNSSPLWEDFTVFSLTPDGTQRWVYTYDGPGSGTDHARSIVYGLDGNIYVAGTTAAGTTNGLDFTVVSLTSSGTFRWIYKYSWPGDPDVAYAITYGLDNNIYAAGEIFAGTGFSYDFTVISLDTVGVFRWIYRYTGPFNDWDIAHAITYGSDNNIYASGTSWNVGTGNDVTVVSLNQVGIQNWTYCLTNSTGWDDAYSLQRIPNGNIYVAGDDGNVTTVNLTSTGTPRWVHAYSGPANGWDGARSLVFGDDGKIYVAGYREGSTGNTDFVVLSLDTITTGMEESQTPNFNNHNTIKIFPNPAKSMLHILSPFSIKNVMIYDATGKLVKSDNHKERGECISLGGIKNGVYFVKVNNELIKEKLVIVK